MGIVFKKILSRSEIKYNFINVPIASIRELDPKFEVFVGRDVFQVKINKADRMVSRRMFRFLKPRMGDGVILQQNANKKYEIHIVKP